MVPVRRSLLITLAVLAVVPAALGQGTLPVRLRATIGLVTPAEVTLAVRPGNAVTLKLTDNTSVVWIVPIPLGAIQPNAFIGVTSVPGDNDILRALEVHVFPESMRGTGEGHRPWDLAPNSTMTNGTVGTVTVLDGRLLTVAYKGGEQKIFVPENVPVVTYQPANRAALTQGAHVIAFANKGADGTLTAVRISVGKDGLVPPM